MDAEILSISDMVSFNFIVVSTENQIPSRFKMSAKPDEETAETENATGVTPEALEEKLKRELEAIHVEIQDMSGRHHKTEII